MVYHVWRWSSICDGCESVNCVVNVVAFSVGRCIAMVVTVLVAALVAGVVIRVVLDFQILHCPPGLLRYLVETVRYTRCWALGLGHHRRRVIV